MSSSGLWGRLIFDRSIDYRVVVSPQVVEEVLEVIQRPRLVRKYRGLARQNLRKVIRTLNEAEGVEIDLAAFPRVCRDAKDDIYLATAKTGDASYLVSEDEDLLVLGEYDGIRIVDADAFLRILDTLRQDAPENA